jgi:UDP-glucose 4-epimerase
MPVSEQAGFTLALTGATGFVGAAVLDQALKHGLRVRALTRRPQPPRDRVEWIDGDVFNAAALSRLADGADAFFHAAGAIKARSAWDFRAVNEQGVENALAAAKGQDVGRFVLVSSLAAREPHLSPYAASKKAGEDAMKNEGHGLTWAIVRPPAVYGPRDKEILKLFRAMKRGFAPTVGPTHRFSLAHVEDFARYALLLVRSPAASECVAEPDDGKAGGYTIADVAAAAGAILGRRVHVVRIPKGLLKAFALLNEVTAPLVGAVPMVTRGKVNEFQHPDWVSDGNAGKFAPSFRPAFTLEGGLAHTLGWYREHGWL